MNNDKIQIIIAIIGGIFVIAATLIFTTIAIIGGIFVIIAALIFKFFGKNFSTETNIKKFGGVFPIRGGYGSKQSGQAGAFESKPTVLNSKIRMKP